MANQPGSQSMHRVIQRFSRLCRLLCLGLVLTGCATQSFHWHDVAGAAFLKRAKTQSQGPLRVTAAVPDGTETEALTGLDLYEQGIQPVWIQVENKSTAPARVAISSIDPDYFSPIEVAYRNRGRLSSQGYRNMQRWFYENGLKRQIPAGETRSGLVFTHLRPGTKGFIVDIYQNLEARSFTFFLPLPGFVPDYALVDLDSLYPEQEIRNLDLDELKVLLEHELPCCAADANSDLKRAPFNTVIVGTRTALRRALLRGGWLETSAASTDELVRGGRQNLFRGRPPDGIFYLDRQDGSVRMQLQLWYSPWRVDSEPVWVGQVFYWNMDQSFLEKLARTEGLKGSELLALFVDTSVAADLDSARRFLMQNMWYNHSLRRVGLVSGVGASTVEHPAVTAGGVGYFTDGLRLVMFLSKTPVTVYGTKLIYRDQFPEKTNVSHD